MLQGLLTQLTGYYKCYLQRPQPALKTYTQAIQDSFTCPKLRGKGKRLQCMQLLNKLRKQSFYIHEALLRGSPEAQANAALACPKTSFYPLLLFYLSIYSTNSSPSSLSIHIPHGWGGPSVAGEGSLGITRLRFCLHLACREMVQGKVSRDILNPKKTKLQGQPTD